MESLDSLPSYVLLSPLGESRSYALEEFFSCIDRFDHKPERVVVCSESKVDNTLDILKIKAIRLIGNEKLSPGLPRITYAREKLREYFLQETSVEWALWIDSDILAPPELPEILLKTIIEKNAILLCNKYPCRGDAGVKWSGSGCILTHRMACEIGRFMVTYFNVDGSIRSLSEDYNFFSLVSGAAPFIKKWSGKEARVIGDFVNLRHWLLKDEIRDWPIGVTNDSI